MAAGTKPHQLVHHPENVQHIAYVGNETSSTNASTSSAATPAGITTCRARPRAGLPGNQSDQLVHHQTENVHTSPTSAPTARSTTATSAATADAGWDHNLPSSGAGAGGHRDQPHQLVHHPRERPAHRLRRQRDLIHECFYLLGGDGAAGNTTSRARPHTGPRPDQPHQLVHHPRERPTHRLRRQRDLIHECFFRLGGTAGWDHNLPSFAHVPAAREPAPPAGTPPPRTSSTSPTSAPTG